MARPCSMMLETTSPPSAVVIASSTSAAVTPYNFPVMIPLWFWPFAIATGNTVVLKPSERDPLTHQRIVDLVMEAGLPPGVLNVVHGDQTVVQALLEHRDVKGVSFVGSSAVARSRSAPQWPERGPAAAADR